MSVAAYRCTGSPCGMIAAFALLLAAILSAPAGAQPPPDATPPYFVPTQPPAAAPQPMYVPPAGGLAPAPPSVPNQFALPPAGNPPMAAPPSDQPAYQQPFSQPLEQPFAQPQPAAGYPGMIPPGAPYAPNTLPAPATAPSANASLPPLSREQVEQIVGEYLSTHSAPPPDQGGYEIGSDGRLRASFANGLVFDSPNGDFYVHVGGMTQFDMSAYGEDPQLTASPFVGGVGPVNDAVDFRRARLRVDGRMYDLVEWAAEYDFANAIGTFGNLPGNPPGYPAQGLTPGLTDLYARFLQVPFFGNLTIGNFKEPIGFEHLVNDRFLEFMERSYNQSVFYGPFNNGFSPGIMLSNWVASERATWALWTGPNQSNPYGYHIGNNAFAFTTRVTYLPIYDGDGRYLLHLGGSFSNRSPDQGQFTARATGNILSGPPGPLNPIYATTGSLSASNQSLVNLELASVWGPLTVQAEYCGEWVDNIRTNPNVIFTPAQQAGLTNGGTAYVQGWYTEALWFLTGESRAYDRRAGVFDRVIPFSNAYWVRTPGCAPCVGTGAWQVALRYSGLDLNTAGVNGGFLNSVTFGVNWYLNPNMKFQWNYDFTHRSQVATVGAGNISSVGMRLAMDF